MIKKVSLIGLGAMGVFFAPKLKSCLGDDDFTVIAGGERGERLKNRGVTLNGKKHFFNIKAPSEVTQPADLVIIAVKDTGLDSAIADIKTSVGEKTVIMCVMNGVDSEERVAAVYGWERVIYSYMRVSVVMEDGVANFDPNWGKVHFGEAKNEVLSERVTAIKELFERAGIDYRIETDMLRGLWYKFMCNVGENLTCALLGVPFAAFQTSQEANFIRYAAMREVIAVANKSGVDIGEEDMQKQEKTIAALPPANKPSTLQDLEKKRRTEIDMFAGKVVRLGRELGVATPVCELLYNGIKVLEQKNEGRFAANT